jgi:hypothetical protein
MGGIRAEEAVAVSVRLSRDRSMKYSVVVTMRTLGDALLVWVDKEF